MSLRGKSYTPARPHCWYLLFVPLLLLSCTVRSSAPDLPDASATMAQQRFQERAEHVRTLTALIAVAYRFGERQGTFDLAVNYAAPGQLRFTALKDTLLQTQILFDLLLTGQEYRLYTQDNAAIQQGQVGDLIRENPTMRAFAMLGEAFFLPGWHALESAVQSHPGGFRTHLPSGAMALWTVDPLTREISQGRLQWPTVSSALRIHYRSYRQVEGIALPEQVQIEERQVRFRADAVLKELDLNQPLPADIFRLTTSAS